MAEILEEVKHMENGQKRRLTKLCWYMRGGLSFEESYYLGPEEREIISKMVEENLETTKKTQMPFF